MDISKDNIAGWVKLSHQKLNLRILQIAEPQV